MAQSFRKGDRVFVDSGYYETKIAGKKGTIINDEDSGSLGVKFDEHMEGHDCNGACTTGFGWFVSAENLKALPEFEVGDKVKCIAGFDTRIIDKTGTIIGINSAADAAIEFDTFMNGHACGGRAKEGYGYNVPFKYIQKIDSTTSIVKQASYVVGDMVKVKENLPTGSYKHHSGGSNSITTTMKPYFGKIMKIVADGRSGYEFEDDKSNCSWTDDMIEGKVVEKKIPAGIKLVDKTTPEKFKIGDKVVAHNKTVGSSRSSHRDNARDHGQPYLYIAGYYKGDYICNEHNVKRDAGDYFRHSDLTLYEEPKVELKDEPKVTPAKFKVGDKVNVISKSVPGYATPGECRLARIAKEGKGYLYLNKIYNNRAESAIYNENVVYPVYVVGEDKDDGGDFFYEKDLVPYIEPKAETKVEAKVGKFKVGDIVKGNSASRYVYTNNLMTKGEVKEVISPTEIRVEILEHEGKASIGSSHRVESEYFDLVTIKLTEKKDGAKPMPVFKYKVGDKVRVTSAKPLYGLGEVSVGDVGVITSIYDVNGRGGYVAYTIDFIAQKGWHGSECDISLASNPFATPAAKTGISLTERKTVVPGITSKVVVSSDDYEEEYDYEYEEEYEEEPCDCEWCLGVASPERTFGLNPCGEQVFMPYQPAVAGLTFTPGRVMPELIRRDIMQAGITLKEMTPYGEMPARGMYPINKKEGQGGIMNVFGKLFGGNIGKDTSGRLALTVAGIAVKNNEGKFVAYKDGSLIDVMDAKFDVDNAFYRIPTTEVKANDIIINQSGVPVIVTKVAKTGLEVVNPYNGLQETIVPSTNLMNLKFYVKVVSLFGDMFKDIDLKNPASFMPFMLMGEGSDMGEMLPLMMMMNGGKGTDMNAMLPLLMLSGKGGDKSDMLLPMMLMGQGGKGLDNSMLPLLMLSGKGGDKSDMLLPLMMMGQGGKGADMNAMLPLLLMGKGGKGGDMMETMLLMNAMGGKGFSFGAPAAAPATTEE